MKILCSGDTVTEALEAARLRAIEALADNPDVVAFTQSHVDLSTSAEDDARVAGSVTFSVQYTPFGVQVIDGTITRIDMPDDLLDVSVGGESLRDAKARLEGPRLEGVRP